MSTAPDAQQSSMTSAPDACRGRGVLFGAFAVLDALAHADDGLGLTALAHASGLAKTSTYRLAQQLVALGAVQCIEHRYYIGALIGRIGQRWQPDPLLRRAAQGPVHNLSVRAGAMASLRILHEERLRLICGTAARGQAYISDPADRELVARTATGRVLYAAQPSADVALPDCWPPRCDGRTDLLSGDGSPVCDRASEEPWLLPQLTTRLEASRPRRRRSPS